MTMNPESSECAVCKFKEVRSEHSSRDTSVYYCPRCGKYEFSHEISYMLRLSNDGQKARLSGALRERQRSLRSDPDATTVLTTTIQTILDSAPKIFDVAVRARRALLNISREAASPADTIPLDRHKDSSLAFTLDVDDFDYILTHLESQGWCIRLPQSEGMHSADEPWRVKITPSGWEEVRRRPSVISTTGFVAMWFGTEVREAYEQALVPAIYAAGFEPRRVDAIEFNEGIVDRILAEIREARFLVADLTGHRQGVYLEAGFAWGLGVPVIWTCRDDHANETHFDAKHLNQIRWKNYAELAEKLENRIRATIGRGPVLPPGEGLGD